MHKSLQSSSTKIGYLVSEYPAFSHTFILHEIQALRKLGKIIVTASINRPQGINRMSPEEQSEAENTFYFKPNLLLKGLWSLSKNLVANPISSLKMIWAAIKYAFSRMNHFPHALAYLFESFLLIDWAKKQGLNHVHVHFANPAAMPAMFAAASGQLSYSLSVHGPDVFDNIRCESLEKKFAGADFIRCISLFSKSQIQRWIPPEQWHKIHVVRCGINPSQFTPATSLSPAPLNPLQILCVGRLVSAKGQTVLVDACKILSEKKFPFHLTFVGGGPDLAHLKEKTESLALEEKISFSGPVNRDEVHHYYNQASIFVLPSFAEGVPIVLMEAMAKKIPCISTQIAGIPELITHEKTGFLVPPADPIALANMIIQAANSPENLKKISVNGLEFVNQEYNLEKNIPRLADLFDAIIPFRRINSAFICDING
jgi:colanic acid/amylovoran biosynthesis glycosyltransferase